MLWNYYFDLTDGVKIQELVVNLYFGNNLVMVILLKTHMEYPFAYSLLRNFFMSRIKTFMKQLQVETSNTWGNGLYQKLSSILIYTNLQFWRSA